MKKIILLVLILIACKNEVIFESPKLSRLQLDTKLTLSKPEFASISKEIFASPHKFCDLSFENQNVNISGDSESGYGSSEKNPTLGLKFSLYKTQKEKN